MPILTLNQLMLNSGMQELVKAQSLHLVLPNQSSSVL